MGHLRQNAKKNRTEIQRAAQPSRSLSREDHTEVTGNHVRNSHRSACSTRPEDSKDQQTNYNRRTNCSSGRPRRPNWATSAKNANKIKQNLKKAVQPSRSLSREDHTKVTGNHVRHSYSRLVVRGQKAATSNKPTTTDEQIVFAGNHQRLQASAVPLRGRHEPEGSPDLPGLFWHGPGRIVLKQIKS